MCDVVYMYIGPAPALRSSFGSEPSLGRNVFTEDAVAAGMSLECVLGVLTQQSSGGSAATVKFTESGNSTTLPA